MLADIRDRGNSTSRFIDQHTLHRVRQAIQLLSYYWSAFHSSIQCNWKYCLHRGLEQPARGPMMGWRYRREPGKAVERAGRPPDGRGCASTP